MHGSLALEGVDVLGISGNIRDTKCTVRDRQTDRQTYKQTYRERDTNR